MVNYMNILTSAIVFSTINMTGRPFGGAGIAETIDCIMILQTGYNSRLAFKGVR